MHKLARGACQSGRRARFSQARRAKISAVTSPASQGAKTFRKRFVPVKKTALWQIRQSHRSHSCIMLASCCYAPNHQTCFSAIHTQQHQTLHDILRRQYQHAAHWAAQDCHSQRVVSSYISVSEESTVENRRIFWTNTCAVRKTLTYKHVLSFA